MLFFFISRSGRIVECWCVWCIRGLTYIQRQCGRARKQRQRYQQNRWNKSSLHTAGVEEGAVVQHHRVLGSRVRLWEREWMNFGYFWDNSVGIQSAKGTSCSPNDAPREVLGWTTFHVSYETINQTTSASVRVVRELFIRARGRLRANATSQKWKKRVKQCPTESIVILVFYTYRLACNDTSWCGKPVAATETRCRW